MHKTAIDYSNTRQMVAPAQLMEGWHKNTALQYRYFADLHVVEDELELLEVRELRIQKLRPEYPDMDFGNDPLDYQSLILFSTDKNGVVSSTARLSFAGSVPFPQAKYLTQLQNDGWRLCEWGRFAIEDGDLSLLKSYYRAMYLLASRMGYDAIVMAMKPKDISMHSKLLNLQIVEPDMKITYGGKHSLACVLWELKQTNQRFFSWTGSTV